MTDEDKIIALSQFLNTSVAIDYRRFAHVEGWLVQSSGILPEGDVSPTLTEAIDKFIARVLLIKSNDIDCYTEELTKMHASFAAFKKSLNA